MFKNKKRIITIFIIALLCVTALAIAVLFENNEVEALSKYGSRGSEVTQIQTKLKRWGYYNGNIDGIYGTQTVNAVKYFQRKRVVPKPYSFMFSVCCKVEQTVFS